MAATRPKIAISACLTGEEVRYNGGHKASRLCNEVLAEHFDFIGICPEVAIGLGTPRQAIRLTGDPANPMAVGSRDASLDVSQALDAYGAEMAGQLTDICGYIFMQKSPSCGLERVKNWMYVIHNIQLISQNNAGHRENSNQRNPGRKYHFFYCRQANK